MRLLAGADDRGPVVSAAAAASGVAVLLLTLPLGLPVFEVSVLVAAVVLAAVTYRTILQWHVLLAFTILVILFIPIKRYALPGNLPLDLEPYRLVVAVIVAGWVTSLLVDPRVRIRASGFEGPVLLTLLAAVASAVANPGRISELGVQTEVLKGIMFLTSFLLVFYLIVSVIRTRELVDFLVKVLVAGGAGLAVFAVVESRTGYNVFEQLGSFLPFLRDASVRTGEVLARAGTLRVFASAQTPISLGAAFVLLVPLAVYLTWRTKRWLWAAAGVLLVLGALAPVSRTSIVMLLPVGLVFLWLRPRQTRRLWPLLVPIVCAAYIAVPGTLGSLKGAFFPAEGLIAQQTDNAGTTGSGRLADIDPALEEWEAQPLLGQGYSTRQTGRENRQALILDNQWLKTLVETGVVGVFAWLWLYARFIRRLGAEAKLDPSPEGVLAAALASSAAAYAAGMFFYDSFSFIQVTFLLYVLLGLGASLLRLSAAERSPATQGSRRAAVPWRPQSSTPG
jgi:O-antigen ligase